jgi:hypothetical protein
MRRADSRTSGIEARLNAASARFRDRAILFVQLRLVIAHDHPPHIEVPSPLHDFSSSALDEGQNLGGHRELGARFSTSQVAAGVVEQRNACAAKAYVSYAPGTYCGQVEEWLTAGGPRQAMIRRHHGPPLWPERARPMAEACTNGEIKPAISFHILRHTWASLAVMNGTPLLVVAKNLGHTDTRMVEKHYGHLAPSFIADAIRAGAPRYRDRDDKRVVPLR